MSSASELAPSLRPLVAGPEYAALFFDFDGTLAPIVADPASSRVLPAARDAVMRLVPLVGRAAVVSGRPAAFLLGALDVDGIGVAGIYGLERVVDGEVVIDPRVDPWLEKIAAAADAAELALPGLRVERKGRVAVTIHWRDDPGRGTEALAWAHEHAPTFGLDAPLRGRMAVELRPPVPIDKGSTAADLARGCRTAVFAGDDAGDVAAFDALHDLARAGVLEHAVSIGVASNESPPEVLAADVVVDGPAGLAALLQRVAEAIESR